MKKIFYFLASAIVALGAMACQNEVDESINPNTQSDVVSFTVAFDEATRIAMTTEGKTANFAFEAGDKLYVQPYAILENDEVFEGNTYEFTTEDGETFSCQSAELVSELAQSGNYAFVDNSADGSIRSNEGVDGFNFATYADLTAETVTLPMSHAVFHFTVPEGTTATLKHTEDIFYTDAVVGWVKEITFTEGEHWVAAWTLSGTLSYSINGVVVKSITKDFEAGKIYNLGTLNYEFTTINTKEQLIAFAEHVNAGNNYKGKTVKLGQSIDLEGEILAPIGNSKANAFRGNFDGQGNTISKFTVEHAEVAGLFGMLAGGSIKNLNVDKATIYGNSYAGGIVAWVQATSYQGWQGAADAVVDNCNVTYTEITSTVINNDNAAKVGGIAGYVVYGTVSNSTVANTNITAYRDMGGIAGMANFASSNGKGAVISGNTVGEDVTITVDNSNNYNNYTTADQYNVASIVGRIATGAIVENNTGEATIVLPKTAVEKLNEQIAAGESTITLTEDIVAGENEKITVPAGKTVTLDLNGYTISQEKVCTASHELICNNGDLTITGEGTISFKDNSEGDPTFGWGSYTIRNTGNLTIENGTIEHLSNLNGAGVKHMYCAVYSYSGNVVINGGTIKSVDYRSVRGWAGSLTINGGNFEGQVWIQPTKANFDLNIKGGTFAPRGGDGSSVFVTNETHTVDVEITGGTFTTKLGASKAVKGWVKGGQFKVDPSAYVAEGYVTAFDGTNYTVVKLSEAWNMSNTTINLPDGAYDFPGISGNNLTIKGSENAVITVTGTPAVSGNATFEGVTIKGKGVYNGVNNGESVTVTYNNVTIDGSMSLYGGKVVFNECAFKLYGDYVWTYGVADVEFNTCTFNCTTSKAILIYNEGAGATNATVTNCTFTAAEGGKAYAIANQNCAAIEIDNNTGVAHKLTTSGNTVGEHFSGEWRIKNYVAGAPVTVNGTEYTQLALDGKLMAKDASNNVSILPAVIRINNMNGWGDLKITVKDGETVLANAQAMTKEGDTNVFYYELGAEHIGKNVSYYISHSWYQTSTKNVTLNQKSTAIDLNTTYLQPSNGWDSDNAWFAAYFYDDTVNPKVEKWVKAVKTESSSNIYEVEIPTDVKKMIFVRMNPGSAALGWSSKWNQTENLTITHKCCCIQSNYSASDSNWY